MSNFKSPSPRWSTRPASNVAMKGERETAIPQSQPPVHFSSSPQAMPRLQHIQTSAPPSAPLSAPLSAPSRPVQSRRTLRQHPETQTNMRGQNPRPNSSERGRQFRERRRRREENLRTAVLNLRRQVLDLEHRRSIRKEALLYRRNSPNTSSLEQLARELYTLFGRGVPTVRQIGPSYFYPQENARILQEQQEYVNRVFDPDVQYHNLQGVEAMLEQWRRVSTWHNSVEVTVDGTAVYGSEEDPIVIVYLTMELGVTDDVIRHVFPNALQHEAVMTRVNNRRYKCHSMVEMHFSSIGRITEMRPTVDYVQGFIDGGVSIQDIGVLLNDCRIQNESIVGEVDNQQEASNNQRATEESSDNGSDDVPSNRLKLEYILS